MAAASACAFGKPGISKDQNKRKDGQEEKGKPGIVLHVRLGRGKIRNFMMSRADHVYLNLFNKNRQSQYVRENH